MKTRVLALLLSILPAVAVKADPSVTALEKLNAGREVHFGNMLPAMHLTTPPNGTYNNYELGFPSILTTSDPDLGIMLYQLRNNILSDRHFVFIDGKALMTSKNWIRDHVHEMKGFCHWEYDLRSFLDFILDTQREDGCYYELIKQIDDEHWSYVDEDCRVMYPEDNLALVRLEIESDIEYLVVEGALCCYRVTGDDEWLRRVLPKLEKGIDYVMSDPKRLDAATGLVKRGYTIDTWDFTYMPDTQTNRRIEEGKTPMAIMHGDNSGVWQAMNQLAWMNRRFGNETRAREWEARADTLRAAIFSHLWNGRHFVHQRPVNVPAYDSYEDVRLSLSNTYDINRGLTDLARSRSIIEEYMSRRDTTSAFAEWFTIDPPYDRFHIYRPGKYVNGAISPFTAGELAKAALNNGYEEYGWDIIRRFEKMMRRDGTVYFLYSRDTGCSESKGAGPSAWGAAAVMSAIDEALAGVCDRGCGYDEIYFCPRFPVTHYRELRYITGYESGHKVVDVRYVLRDNGMRYLVKSPAVRMDCHILLPAGSKCRSVRVNGRTVRYENVNVASSRYVDFKIRPDGIADIEILL